MVFQSYALFRHMTVADNISFGPRIQDLDIDEEERYSVMMVSYLAVILQSLMLRLRNLCACCMQLDCAGLCLSSAVSWPISIDSYLMWSRSAML